MRARALLASLSVVGVLACGGAGPSSSPAFAAYKQAADKILNDYDVAMGDVAQIDVKLVALAGGTPTMTTDQAVEALDKIVIPKLENVAKAASAIGTPDYPHLTAAHKPLVAGLNGKVEGYKGMTEAYRKRDSAAFDAALSKLLESDALVKKYRADLQRASELGDYPADGSAATAQN